jgi:hypothetical protein
MMRAIHDAGFTPVPEDVRLTLTGTLESRGGSTVLVLSDMKAPRELPCAAAAGDGKPLSLGEYEGRKVEVRGRWRPDGEGLLKVEEIGASAGAQK